MNEGNKKSVNFSNEDNEKYIIENWNEDEKIKLPIGMIQLKKQQKIVKEFEYTKNLGLKMNLEIITERN